MRFENYAFVRIREKKKKARQTDEGEERTMSIEKCLRFRKICGTDM